jgi:hypothetical protein
MYGAHMCLSRHDSLNKGIKLLFRTLLLFLMEGDQGSVISLYLLGSDGVGHWQDHSPIEPQLPGS